MPQGHFGAIFFLTQITSTPSRRLFNVDRRMLGSSDQLVCSLGNPLKVEAGTGKDFANVLMDVGLWLVGIETGISERPQHAVTFGVVVKLSLAALVAGILNH